MSELQPGLTGESTRIVTEQLTAAFWGSGLVLTFATPALIALMENAAVEAVNKLLPEGQTTVGAEIAVKHLAATPLGMRVTARAELVAVEGRKLLFNVTAFDEREKIGEGMHVRYVIDRARFEDRVRKKGTGEG
jgi:predicted thioesterase